MNDIGTISNYSAYIDKASSAYKTNQLSHVKEQPDSSCAEKVEGRFSPNAEIKDEAIISEEAKTLLAQDEKNQENNMTAKEKDKQSNEDEQNEDAKTRDSRFAQAKEELTLEQKQEVAKLKARDIEVKSHEQAHIAAASGISASAPSYDYQIGPDGKKYAVGGEVNISFVESGNPSSDIEKAKIMKNAALAPANPSSQDLSVARSADRMVSEFKQEIAEEQKEEAERIKASKQNETPQPMNNTEVETAGKVASKDPLSINHPANPLL